ADLAAILASLRADDGRFAAAQLRELATKSPLALHLTCAQLRRGRELAIEDAFQLEYRMVHRVLAGHDFHEGVRALLIDKDRRPRWRDHQGHAIAAAVAAAMSPLPSGELELDWQGT
ncbi:MAG: enoyl-CoA hydratase/isomerase family protein, partial [Geminicoccaceae bacterium]